MSDPVTNVEIEDVLSSIRRLVSSDDKSRPVAPAASAEVPADAERLVLTPALRVDESAAEKTAARDAPYIATTRAEPEELRGPIMPPEDAAEVTSADLPGSDESPEDATANPQTEPVAHHAPRQDSKAELQARVAELEEVVSRQADQWEPDGASDDANSGSAASHPLPWEDYVPAAEDGSPQMPDPAARERSSADKAQDEEAAPSQADDLPKNFAADDRPEANEAAAQDARDFLSAQDEFLDEDALRDLVADIVRQELQGALGERITRNVRKLVRREIHRALVSQDLQ
ncbi:hypothetical protein DC366_04860 [Pelagivirga sediminicola]|uniref:Uncharacterized protein n=1 Tax=Pelagivirga sediminicola TaxID=2170575 RepID=A0A2T7G9L9_9RHOB|nr:hypothetical protein [Pelagivirga sediminicola]PVA11096.1 hypothetical protein DC366_04860 [Pelagivirga sediminicola]